MATLTNTKIKDTYDGLLKTTDNEALDASGVTLIEDGLGNASAISVGRSGNGIEVTGDVSIADKITHIGDTNTAIRFPSADTVTIETSGTERVRILSTGGLTFNGDTATANALNDYEEGEFTPEFADAATGGNVATGSSFNGAYTKIGRQVTISIQASNIDTTGMTGGNQLYIRDLPFAAGSLTGAINFIGAIKYNQLTLSANSVGVIAQLIDNQDYIRINENYNDGTDGTQLTVSQLTSGATDIFISLTYFA